MDIEEVFDDQRWLDGWAGRDGGRPPFAEIPLESGELLPAGALDDAKPDSQRLHEASGYAEDVSNMRTLVESAPGGRQARRCAADLERLREAVAAAG